MSHVLEFLLIEKIFRYYESPSNSFVPFSTSNKFNIFPFISHWKLFSYINILDILAIGPRFSSCLTKWFINKVYIFISLNVLVAIVMNKINTPTDHVWKKFYDPSFNYIFLLCTPVLYTSYGDVNLDDFKIIFSVIPIFYWYFYKPHINCIIFRSPMATFKIIQVYLFTKNNFIVKCNLRWNGLFGVKWIYLIYYLINSRKVNRSWKFKN